jgi:hypothetical protein
VCLQSSPSKQRRKAERRTETGKAVLEVTHFLLGLGAHGLNIIGGLGLGFSEKGRMSGDG